MRGNKTKASDAEILVIDSHEKEYVFEAFTEANIPYIVEELVFETEEGEEIQIGDFTNEARSWVAEHKGIIRRVKDKVTNTEYHTEGDFYDSVMNKRLFEQLANMMIFFSRNRTLICEGHLVNLVVNHPAQRNYLYSVVGHCSNMNISFVECYDMAELVEKIYWINKEAGTKSRVNIDVKSSAKMLGQVAFLAKIPTIGEHNAILLLKQYLSLTGVLKARPFLDWLEIHGIGKKTVETAINFFNEPVGDELNKVDLEDE